MPIRICIFGKTFNAGIGGLTFDGPIVHIGISSHFSADFSLATQSTSLHSFFVFLVFI